MVHAVRARQRSIYWFTLLLYSCYCYCYNRMCSHCTVMVMDGLCGCDFLAYVNPGTHYVCRHTRLIVRGDQCR